MVVEHTFGQICSIHETVGEQYPDGLLHLLGLWNAQLVNYPMRQVL